MHASLRWQHAGSFVEDPEVIRVFGNRRMILNLSVWDSYDELKHFVFRTAHGDAMRERQHWFDSLEARVYVLWWVPAGHCPTLEEAKQKLDLLALSGPTPAAFDFLDGYDWHGSRIVSGRDVTR